MRAFSYAWSRDKDGSHTNRYAIFENPTLHAKFMALCFTEPESDRSFTLWKKRIVDLCCSCDLDIDLMTFMYKRDP